MPHSRSSWPRANAFLLLCLLGGCPENGKPEPADEPARDSAIDDSTAQTDASTSRPDASTNGSDAAVSTNVSPTSDAGLPGTDYEAFVARVAKLKSCDLLDDGAYPFFLPFHQRCESLCMIAASCAQLKIEACDEDVSDSLELCFDDCVDDVVTCGDGQRVASDLACDLESDCKNGEDEKHCETFTCKVDGRKIGAYYRCDGSADCSDLSDEVGCALVCGKPFAQSEP